MSIDKDWVRPLALGRFRWLILLLPLLVVLFPLKLLLDYLNTPYEIQFFLFLILIIVGAYFLIQYYKKNH